MGKDKCGSGSFERYLGKVLKVNFYVDVIKQVEGVPVEMTIYTFDVAPDYDSLRNDQGTPKGENYQQVAVDFENDCYYRELQAMLHPAFLNSYKAGFQAYFEGDWGEANQLLQEALNFKENDPPTLRLLAKMQETDFQAPDDWEGYVVLDDF